MADPVVVVGAGPVGLFTALALIEHGIEPRVIERRAERRSGSRSIGVHPPSLELLDRLRLGDAFVARGVPVRRGHAFGASGALGTIDFGGCPGAHRYVLTIAQEDTEQLLERALLERAPNALARGVELVALRPGAGAVEVDLRDARGARTLRAAAVIGCDGKRSATRAAASIGALGAPYEGSYAMADFPDATRFGDDAAVFLAPGGLVESFPLPRRMRRWVIRRDAPDAEPHGIADEIAAEIAETVERRTGHCLPSDAAQAASVFCAERSLATELARGRVALAGDAAHVVSPIGGQGMNLGWRGAWSLARALATSLSRGDDPSAALAADAKSRARAARAAARRAELNMWLGRPTSRAADRDRVVATLLRRPIAPALARVFTMRGLEAGL